MCEEKNIRTQAKTPEAQEIARNWQAELFEVSQLCPAKETELKPEEYGKKSSWTKYQT